MIKIFLRILLALLIIPIQRSDAVVLTKTQVQQNNNHSRWSLFGKVAIGVGFGIGIFLLWQYKKYRSGLFDISNIGMRKTGPHRLLNRGSTCFFNATAQAFFASPAIQRSFTGPAAQYTGDSLRKLLLGRSDEPHASQLASEAQEAIPAWAEFFRNYQGRQQYIPHNCFPQGLRETGIQQDAAQVAEYLCRGLFFIDKNAIAFSKTADKTCTQCRTGGSLKPGRFDLIEQIPLGTEMSCVSLQDVFKFWYGSTQNNYVQSVCFNEHCVRNGVRLLWEALKKECDTPGSELRAIPGLTDFFANESYKAACINLEPLLSGEESIAQRMTRGCPAEVNINKFAKVIDAYLKHTGRVDSKGKPLGTNRYSKQFAPHIQTNFANRQNYIGSPPNVFVIQLKRFDEQGRKNTRPVICNQTLDLSDCYAPSARTPGTSYVYELRSVVVHRGSRIDTGHYVAYVRYGLKWYCCSDMTIEPITLKSMDNFLSGKQSEERGAPYLLLYDKKN